MGGFTAGGIIGFFKVNFSLEPSVLMTVPFSDSYSFFYVLEKLFWSEL
jgi:hypothetical protein